ncbi:hypothetical protein ACP3P8_24900 [Pseudomonas aeruginosa]
MAGTVSPRRSSACPGRITEDALEALTLDLAEEECATLEAPLTVRARTPRW